MITFSKIRYRNFLSTGNNFTEINFQKTQNTLIIGSNGSGKSTLLDALCFCLFNKAFRKITKSQLVNSTNEKDCVVELEFETLNSQWKIVRGIKPAIFEIHRNGEVLDQLASNNDQQSWLEKNVLKLNFKSFTQIVILGSASFVPFMQLSSSHRREVVEDLLDIRIFSSMNGIIKEKIKGAISKTEEIHREELALKEKIEMQKKMIANIEKNKEEQIKSREDKIKVVQEEIEIITKDNAEINKKIEEIQSKVDALAYSPKKTQKLTNLQAKVQDKIETEQQQIQFFNESSVCPTCTQNIEESFRLNKRDEHQQKLEELKSGYVELCNAIEDEKNLEREFAVFQKEIQNLNYEISNNNVEISALNRQSREYGNEIQGLASRNEDADSERGVLEKLKTQLFKLTNDRSKYREITSYYMFTHGLLKDGGVKAKIIKRYLPLMNQQINKYLQIMDFYVNFSLDEEFNETVKTPIHENFSYSSFSEGEKMRINLALLFTWREIAQMKNSISTNLLILDEVFDSSLDGMGIEHFYKIIRYVISNTNVMVISHKTDEMLDYFDTVLKFEKIKGFSKIVG